MPIVSPDRDPTPTTALVIAGRTRFTNSHCTKTTAALAAGAKLAREQRPLPRAMEPREV